MCVLPCICVPCLLAFVCLSLSPAVSLSLSLSLSLFLYNLWLVTAALLGGPARVRPDGKRGSLGGTLKVDISGSGVSALADVSVEAFGTHKSTV